MTIKASARPVLILAAGLFVGLAGPSQAATGAAETASSKSEAAGTAGKHARHSSHRQKKYAQRKSIEVAPKSAADKPAGAADDGDNSDPVSAIPPSVANANAQLASADTPTDKAARAMSERANEILQAAPLAAADAQVVSPDQLNDLDRALPDSASPAPALTMASAEPPAAAEPAPAPPAAASSNQGSTSDESSLIGKIFIGFGALLTMGSAARMFMA